MLPPGPADLGQLLSYDCRKGEHVTRCPAGAGTLPAALALVGRRPCRGQPAGFDEPSPVSPGGSDRDAVVRGVVLEYRLHVAEPAPLIRPPGDVTRHACRARMHSAAAVFAPQYAPPQVPRRRVQSLRRLTAARYEPACEGEAH